MKIAVFDTRPYDRASLSAANAGHGHDLTFLEARLTPLTAALARGFPAVCAFVNDVLSDEVLSAVAGGGTKLVAMRCAGYNNVDVAAAGRLGIAVVRVPEYSPHAVAEFALGLVLTLNRKIHRAYNRVREMNFSLNGLEGFDLFGKTVGIVGTGKIGRTFGAVMLGLGCNVIAYDVVPNPEFAARPGVRYTDLAELFAQSDVISLHAPLMPATRHMLDEAAFAAMKPGVMVINTGRGALIDTPALVLSLKSGKVGAAGLDVYEEEAGVFYTDHSDAGVDDDVLARLMTFPNVIVTSHQAFLTREALANIADATLSSVTAFEKGQPLVHQVRA